MDSHDNDKSVSSSQPDSLAESGNGNTAPSAAAADPAPGAIKVMAPENTLARPVKGGGSPPAAPPAAPAEEPGDDEDGMLRMSFMEHLEELRTRILRALMGLAVAFIACMYWSNELWNVISQPAQNALRTLGFQDVLVFTGPMESFSIIWIKVPMLASIFVASPWILYQVWAFIAPGLYKRERRWAVPFVLSSAGLFILGGLFAYFIAFRFGLTFLLGIGKDIHVRPMITITEYFDMFVNVTLGIGLVFEMPILIFFLILLRIVTPKFLIANSRYAILIITIIAAVVTPTPDVYNMMLFATPMCLLYFVGVFAGFLLVRKRDTGKFPIGIFLAVIGSPVAVFALAAAVAVWRYGFKLVPYWPFLVR